MPARRKRTVIGAMFTFLTLVASHPSVFAGTANLRIELDDYAELKPAFRQQLVTIDKQFLARAGISANVDVCGLKEEERCQAMDRDTRQIFIRLIETRDRKAPYGRWRCLGSAIVSGHGSTYAEVFVKPVRDEASETGMPRVVVLAYATMHEAGHLLLGDQTHTPTGLMKAHWDQNDYREMTRDRLSFSRSQTEMLRNLFGGAGKVGSPAP